MLFVGCAVWWLQITTNGERCLAHSEKRRTHFSNDQEFRCRWIHDVESTGTGTLWMFNGRIKRPKSKLFQIIKLNLRSSKMCFWILTILGANLLEKFGNSTRKMTTLRWSSRLLRRRWAGRISGIQGLCPRNRRNRIKSGKIAKSKVKQIETLRKQFTCSSFGFWRFCGSSVSTKERSA